MTTILRLVVVIAVASLLAGCAAAIKRGPADAAVPTLPSSAASRLVLNVGGPKSVIDSSDWSGFKSEWQENFANQAAAAGIPFAMQDGEAKPTGVDGTLLVVEVRDYRFLRPGTRYMAGVMTGNAYIESTLTYRDLKTGRVLGSQSANTSSSAWEGIFSAMTNKQVEAIAADVVEQLKGGTPK